MPYGLVENWEKASQIVLQFKKDNRKVVFTNGCFDIIHRAHVELLEYARSLGDLLIVGLNSDESVRRLKGPDRPIFRLADRAKVLTSLRPVDMVVPFSQDTPLLLIKTLKPDIIVKGGDYTEESVVGAELVRSWGGVVKIFNFIEGYSTTKIIEKLKRK